MTYFNGIVEKKKKEEKEKTVPIPLCILIMSNARAGARNNVKTCSRIYSAYSAVGKFFSPRRVSSDI